MPIPTLISFPQSVISAFGGLEVNELSWVFQSDFVYGLNVQRWETPVVSGAGASVDTSNRLLRIQSGTASNGYAYLTSRRPLRYRAGQGNLARFTPIFAPGVAGNTQLWGVGTIQSNLPWDGFFFGYNGTSFGIAHYIGGVASWYPQSTWNGDPVLRPEVVGISAPNRSGINWNTQKGSPVMIKYPYLGFGVVSFYLQNNLSGEWILLHTIQYGNLNTNTLLTNPALSVVGFNGNSGNTRNQTMNAGSFGVATSGQASHIGDPKWGVGASLTVNGGAEAPVISIQNSTNFNGVVNHGIMRFNHVSFCSDAGGKTGCVSALRIVRRGTLGGVPVFTPIDGTTTNNCVSITGGNCIAGFDTAATSLSGGLQLFYVNQCPPASSQIDLTPYDIFLAPGEMMSFSVKTDLVGKQGVSVNWTSEI